VIPVCEPFIGEIEFEYVVDCLKTNWLSSKGKYIEEFERKFANYCSCQYGVTTTSGTTALHLAIVASGIGKGDEVIVPTFTMISTVFAIVYTGAKPVLIDSEPETWNIDVGKIEEKITPQTKAILPVHVYGHPCDMEPIEDIADKYGLYVIEDAAEAHGAEYNGRRIGGIGDIGCFSFYANKIITTGEGGMIVTNNQEIAERSRSLKDLSFSKEKRFLHKELGFNYRMTNIQAAIGLAQFNRIDELVEIRRKNAYFYNSLLKDIKGIRLPIEKEWARNVYWMYSILIKEDFGIDRDELIDRLREKGIEARTFFIPMHQQPVFTNMGLFRGERYPVAEEFSQRGLYLPSGSGLTEEQIDYVCTTIKEIHGSSRSGLI
jgi:perosamine synthetase